MKEQYRLEFEGILLRRGLVLEREVTPEEDGCYVKVITSFDIMCEEAEE